MRKIFITPIILSLLFLTSCSSNEEISVADVDVTNLETKEKGQSHELSSPQSEEILEEAQSQETTTQASQIDSTNDNLNSTIGSLFDGSYTELGDPTTFKMTYGPSLQQFLNQSDNRIVQVNTLREFSAVDTVDGVQYTLELSVNTSLVLPGEDMHSAARRVHQFVSQNVNSVESQIIQINVNLNKNSMILEKVN